MDRPAPARLILSTATLWGWTLTFAFPNGQTVSGGWNAAFSQSGANVSVTANQSWNMTIAPGATMSGVGFNGTWTGSNGKPIAAAVNGAACGVS